MEREKMTERRGGITGAALREKERAMIQNWRGPVLGPLAACPMPIGGPRSSISIKWGYQLIIRMGERFKEKQLKRRHGNEQRAAYDEVVRAQALPAGHEREQPKHA